MSKICNCRECGGTEDLVFCENKMTNAWVEANKKRHWIELVVGIVAIALAFFIAIFM